MRHTPAATHGCRRAVGWAVVTMRWTDLVPVVLGVRTDGGGPGRVRPLVVGTTVVVTGASRGIGRVVAQRLACVGAHVVAVARSRDDLVDLEDRVRAAGGVLEHRVVDLRDTDAATAVAEEVVATLGVPHLLVANAGHSIHRYLEASQFHDMQRLAQVNYAGAVAFAMPVLREMARRGRGHLVTTSSTQVDVPLPGWSAYSASKTAFDTWLAGVSPELRAAGVAVSSIHLPRVTTAMSAPTAGRYPVPELSVDQAADIVCRAVVTRARRVRPWWAGATKLVVDAAPGVADELWAAVLRTGARP